MDEQLDALAGGNRIVWEQYADLLAGRAFRQTLLCRRDAPIDEAIDPGRLARLWLCATERPGEDGAGRATAPTAAPRRNGSSGPAAVARLALARPRALSFDELHDALGGPDPGALAAELWRAFRAGEVELSAAPDRHVDGGGRAPRGEPGRALAGRARAGADQPAPRPGAARRPARPLPRSACATARATVRALVDALVAGVGTELQLTMEGTPVTDGEAMRGQLADGLERNLEILATLGMLRA